MGKQDFFGFGLEPVISSTFGNVPEVTGLIFTVCHFGRSREIHAMRMAFDKRVKNRFQE